MSSVRARLQQALGELIPVLDIVHGPVEDGAPPAWCEKRGWTEFLLALRDDDLHRCEEHGLEAGLRHLPSAPPELLALAARARQATILPRLSVPAFALPPAALRGVPARKREQLGALLGVAAPLAAWAARVVDVGAGSGHLARLSAELFQRETVGLERDAARLSTARRRTEQRAQTVGALPVRFAAADVGPHRLDLERTDLAVGLHACGDLGDRLVLAAAAARCDLFLCSCCFQKIATPGRAMLSRSGGTLTLEKHVLGLANLTSQAAGVEASLTDNLRGREARLALRRLLQARGLDVTAGEEMRGVNRRRAHAGFSELATKVLTARRLPPPTATELRFHTEDAAREHAAMRRLALPRHLLSRLVEVSVVLDRAVRLEEEGQSVLVAELCDQRITPRNTVLVATADARRLPAAVRT